MLYSKGAGAGETARNTTKLMKKSTPTTIKKIFSAKFFILAVLVLVIVLSLAGGRNFLKRYQINREVENLKAAIAKEEAANRELAGLIEYLGTDFFAEEEGRLKLGLQKPGEQVVVVPEMSGTLARLAEKEYNEKEPSNPRKWWNYFFE